MLHRVCPELSLVECLLQNLWCSQIKIWEQWYKYIFVDDLRFKISASRNWFLSTNCSLCNFQTSDALCTKLGLICNHKVAWKASLNFEKTAFDFTAGDSLVNQLTDFSLKTARSIIFKLGYALKTFRTLSSVFQSPSRMESSSKC